MDYSPHRVLCGLELTMSYCTRCGGEGKLYASRYGGNDPDVWATGECPVCEGTGSEPEECADCGQKLPLRYPCQQQGCPSSPLSSNNRGTE